ncbi:diaminopimelate decarboxylase [Plantactinospora endophytica]|uniref:Diaminopimelate decarboxylase n=1 Tax=Plantactinospora endophytica TaxID=673535 RepID=A0ABQ4DZK6_9ACTN|nr:diaminopimelate decarboxylase [Plantactinospora endophytica]GIG87879.1 diaminopimelate decarboxylase [Plantactinospora endophytica]
MPMSPSFAARFEPIARDVAEHFGTPFHIYDERGIEETCAAFNDAFAGTGYREFFAVKALPNPAVLAVVARYGFGFDASSPAELAAAAAAGATGADICFTSNNTPRDELVEALHVGALVTIDDEAVLRQLLALGPPPARLAFRLHPSAADGTVHAGLLGDTESAKFGIPADRLVPAVTTATAAGVEDIGLHLMRGSQLMHAEPFSRTLGTLLDLAVRLRDEAGVAVSSVNLGGGIGIPYRPGETPFDLKDFGATITAQLERWERHTGQRRPRLHLESGRAVTGPHGVLVTRVINRMHKARTMIGVDAGMSALMRPALYDAYHHVTVLDGQSRPTEVVDVVGSLCENNDKLAVQRELPRTDVGDLMIVHDTGAHGWSMGFTYNGRLRPQELLLHADGTVSRIRRAETVADQQATLRFPATVLSVRRNPSTVR